MAHNLNFNNGKASMFYVGETPWHKLGTKLDKPATAEEAIKEAQLDYPVIKCPLTTLLPKPNVECPSQLVLDVPNHFATVRMDTNKILGVVGSRYEIIPNTIAFSFFDGLVDRDEAMYHTAGVIGEGERCWMLAKLPDYIRVGKDDLVEKYVLLVNSHNGTTATLAKFTSIRVVCNNTLSSALSGGEQEVRIRHTANAELKLQQAHKILGLYNGLSTRLEEIFNQMLLKNITGDQLVNYVETLIPKNEEAESSTRIDNVRDRIFTLHESGIGSDLSRGTMWGAYNAVTEYVDHVQGSTNPEKALKSIWFGGGERLKTNAFRLATLLS